MPQQNLKKVIEILINNQSALPTIAVSGGIDSITLAVFISNQFKKQK